MLRELWYGIRSSPARCRDRLLDFWHCGDRALLGLLAIPGAVVAVMGSLMHFAHSDHIRLRAEQHRHAELRCLAENVYHEGRGEPLPGQRAIAEVTLNRVASPRFPDTVCKVVHEKRLDRIRGRYVGAFSWTEIDVGEPAGKAWERAWQVALTAYEGGGPALVPGALYYHAARVTPRWARQKRALTRIGEHIFYP